MKGWRQAIAFGAISLALAAGFYFASSPCASAQAGRGCGPCFPDWFMGGTTWTINDSAGNDLARFRDLGTQGAVETDFIRTTTTNGNLIIEDSAGNDLARVTDDGAAGSLVATWFLIGNWIKPLATNGDLEIYDSGGSQLLAKVVDEGTTGALVISGDEIRNSTAGGGFQMTDDAQNIMGRFNDLGSVGRLDINDIQVGCAEGRICDNDAVANYIEFGASSIDYATDKNHIFSFSGAEKFRVASGGIQVGSGTAIVKIGKYSATIDFGSITETCSGNTIAATGVALGDTCTVGRDGGLINGSFYTCEVRAADLVTVNHCCIVEDTACNPASQTFYVTTFEY